MKKAGVVLSVFYCLVGFAAWGESPWGEHREVAAQPHGVQPIEQIARQKNAGLFFSVLPYVLKHKPVRVHVDISRLGPTNVALQKEMEEKVAQSYREWFDQAVLWFDGERRDEFEDILPVLQAGIDLRFGMGEQDADYRSSEVEVVIFPTRQAFQREMKKVPIR